MVTNVQLSLVHRSVGRPTGRTIFVLSQNCPGQTPIVRWSSFNIQPRSDPAKKEQLSVPEAIKTSSKNLPKAFTMPVHKYSRCNQQAYPADNRSQVSAICETRSIGYIIDLKKKKKRFSQQLRHTSIVEPHDWGPKVFGNLQLNLPELLYLSALPTSKGNKNINVLRFKHASEMKQIDFRDLLKCFGTLACACLNRWMLHSFHVPTCLFHLQPLMGKKRTSSSSMLPKQFRLAHGFLLTVGYFLWTVVIAYEMVHL